MLREYIEKKKREKGILLMTHIVMGAPDMTTSAKTVEAMVMAGVDLMELQIPFTEPVADGPVILAANQASLDQGTAVADCFAFAKEVAGKYPIPFLFMSYYNILFKYGVPGFAQDMAIAGLKGAIVPDLPCEEAEEYCAAMRQNKLDPVFLFAPTTSDARMTEIAKHGSGFIYCIARKGVTGADTSFSESLDSYLGRARKVTNLPIALGFGVKAKADIDHLRDKADIAIIGTQSLRVLAEKGVDGVGEFIAGLR
ncbi:MAG: tryptophan synthase subunit alpha [Spirochaetaceae bacterium]|nr:MAG: tryptophan synthase subunit alpha [Spirochaetaceae bacterium]